MKRGGTRPQACPAGVRRAAPNNSTLSAALSGAPIRTHRGSRTMPAWVVSSRESSTSGPRPPTAWDRCLRRAAAGVPVSEPVAPCAPLPSVSSRDDNFFSSLPLCCLLHDGALRVSDIHNAHGPGLSGATRGDHDPIPQFNRASLVGKRIRALALTGHGPLSPKAHTRQVSQLRLQCLRQIEVAIAVGARTGEAKKCGRRRVESMNLRGGCTAPWIAEGHLDMQLCDLRKDTAYGRCLRARPQHVLSP